MIKVRRVYADWSSEDQKLLNSKGLILSSESGYGSFDIQEGELYNSLSPFLNKKRKNYFNEQIGTIFNEEDINKSDYYAVFLPIKGYPQSIDSESYMKFTFVEFYESSGIKPKGQQNPFVLKGEPKWKKGELAFSLFWEYDAFFAKKQFFENHLLPLGLTSRKVLINKKGDISQSTVQVILPFASSPLKIENTIYDKGYNCPESGISKYSQQILDFLPAFENPINQKICLSQEVFGEGQLAYHKIIIDKSMLDTFVKHKIIKKITDVHPLMALV